MTLFAVQNIGLSTFDILQVTLIQLPLQRLSHFYRISRYHNTLKQRCICVFRWVWPQQYSIWSQFRSVKLAGCDQFALLILSHLLEFANPAPQPTSDITFSINSSTVIRLFFYNMPHYLASPLRSFFSYRTALCTALRTALRTSQNTSFLQDWDLRRRLILQKMLFICTSIGVSSLKGRMNQ